MVHFIEYLNAKHADELNQLRAELAQLRSAAPVQAPVRSQELEALQEENAALKALLTELQQRCDELQAQKAPAVSSAAAELEAYRRAERTERVARERAEQVYHRVNGVLSDASVKVDEAYAQIGELSGQVSAQLAQLQEAVTGSRQALSDAAATLYSIRPTGDNS